MSLIQQTQFVLNDIVCPKRQVGAQLLSMSLIQWTESVSNDIVCPERQLGDAIVCRGRYFHDTVCPRRHCFSTQLFVPMSSIQLTQFVLNGKVSDTIFVDAVFLWAQVVFDDMVSRRSMPTFGCRSVVCLNDSVFRHNGCPRRQFNRT